MTIDIFVAVGGVLSVMRPVHIPALTKFLGQREFLNIVLRLLKSLELLFFGQVYRATRSIAQVETTQHYSHLLTRFVHHYLQKFNQLFTDTNGMIIGSCPINMDPV